MSSVDPALQCTSRGAVVLRVFRSSLYRFGAMGVAASVLMSCQSQTPVSQQPLELPPSLSTSQSVLNIATPYGHNEILLSGKSGPYWALVSFNSTTHGTEFITPPGVSTRGGIAVATNDAGDIVAGIHAYQSLLISPIYLSTTNGKSWSTAEINYPLSPITRAVALTQNTVYAAVSQRQGSDFIVRSSLPNMSSFSKIQSPPGLRKVVAIYGYSGGVLALYRGASTKTMYEASYSSATGNWTSYGKVPRAIHGASIVTSSAGSETAATCTEAGQSSGSITLAVRVLSSSTPTSTLETLPSTTSASSFLGCSPLEVKPTLSVAVWSKAGKGRVQVSLISSPTSGASLDSYLLPSLGNGTPEFLSLKGGLFLYDGSSKGVELRDLSNSTNFSSTINGVLAYVFKQVRAN